MALVEEAVAGGAGRDALAAELLFRRNAQILGGRAGGDDQRIAGVAAVVARERERALREIHRVDVIVDDLGVEALGVRLHALHQRRAQQAVRVAGPVVDFGGRHELAALLHAGDQQGFAVGARGVDGGGVAGRAGTEDDERAVSRSAHV